MSERVTLDIGELALPTLIFGGPYSNLEAITELRVIAEKKNIPPSQIICTGDIIAYCGDPLATAECIQNWRIHCIQGNVEEQIINDQGDCGCNFPKGGQCENLSEKWYEFARKQISLETKTWLSTLPKFLRFSLRGKKGIVFHGGYENISEFIFPSTSWERKSKEFQNADADIILCGHSGIPFIHSQDEQHWINAGVMGMPPNDGKQGGWYALISEEDGKPVLEFSRFSYDVTTASQKMKDAHLPSEYSQALLTGLWPNDEILPLPEQQQKGKELQFPQKFVL